MINMNESGKSGGIGFVGCLTITFIILKIIGKIDWPWIMVLSPIWITVLIVALICIIYIIGR